MVRRFSKETVRMELFIIFLFASSASWCFSQTQDSYIDAVYSKVSFSNDLALITRCLEKNELNEIQTFTTPSFLSGITNSANKVLVQQYAQRWIEKYSDSFPEVFLIHCMADGDPTVTKEIYHSLTNRISKNCARWSLMVKGETLDDEPLRPKQGKYFKNDYELWDAWPARSKDNSITKQFYLKRIGLLPLLHREIGCGIVVVRADNVPVPWGNELKPNLNFYPYQVPKNELFSVNDTQQLTASRRLGYTAFLPSIALHYGNLPSTPDNKVWTFFKKLYSPYIFLGGQVISSQSCNEIRGNIYLISRSLVCKKLTSKELNFSNSEQDLVISQPICFSLNSEGESFHIEFSNAAKGVSR